MPRITKEPQERRQEILETALRLFCENGYEKTSIADIAKELQIAQGLCYRYFPSKEAIFDTALEQYTRLLVSRVTRVFQQEQPSLRDMILEMPSFLDVETDDSLTYKLCHSPQSRKIHFQLSMAVCEKLQPIVKAALDRARERGEITVSDTQAAASFCVYGQLGILLQMELSGEERVRRTKAFLLKLLNLI